MELLNSKSILECDEDEELQHNQEIDSFIEYIYKLENYDCALMINRQDKEDEKEIIKNCKLHQILNSIEYVDIKIGVDLYIDNGFAVFVCYGQRYILNGKRGIVTNIIQVLPYDSEQNFVKLF